MGSDELIDVEKATPEQHKAAAKIQARQRGKKDREKVKKLKEEKKKSQES